jgi:hypothetical protein
MLQTTETLERHVAARGGRFDLLTALAVTDRLLVTVAKLHAKGVVIRHLEPAKVRITADGGLEIDDVSEGSLALGESRDLYSVGTLLAWMLTGQTKLDDRELRRYPARVSAFLTTAVCPIARRRFSSAIAMRRAVLELLLKYGRLRYDREG